MARVFVTALLLVFAGSYLASLIQTDNGTVKVQDVRFVGSAGQIMSGLLYVPANATESSPQPGVLAIHGYINSRETQSGYAIELARRGIVVLSIDQTGHGYSEPPAFAHGFGGPDGLQYLRSLAFVDISRIGLEGHSMGGWAALMAASAQPEAYEAIVLSGSSTGTLGTPDGTVSFPRNLLVVFSRYDEFSEFMWGTSIPADIITTEKIKTLFGSDQDIKVGFTYGNTTDGSARRLVMPNVIHPGDHLSTQAIGEVVDWLQMALKPELARPANQQTWYWKEFGTLLALIAFSVLVIPVASYVLSIQEFTPLMTALPYAHGIEGKGWYIAAILSAAIPIITFFPLQTAGSIIVPPNGIWAQSITTGIVLWMMGNSIISMLLFGLWLRFGQRAITLRSQCGLGDLHEAGRSLLFAIAVFLLLYFLALVVDFFFLTDLRFWVVALKLMSRMQFFQFLFYLPFFCVFFISLGLTLHTQLRIRGLSTRTAMLINSLILASGFVILLVCQYLPLLMGYTMAIASQPLLTIIAFQFVPLMIVIASISTWCFYQTGSVYPGGFLNGLLITWYVVAGQATQGVPIFG